MDAASKNVTRLGQEAQNLSSTLASERSVSRVIRDQHDAAQVMSFPSRHDEAQNLLVGGKAHNLADCPSSRVIC